MDLFQPFHDLVDDPAGYARQWKEKHQREVIGTFCSYAPEEVILAAGALGYRIFGTGTEISKADAHMQAYSCSLVRGALEESLTGGLAFIDGVVFPHTCDSIQRLSDIWRINVKSGFHLDLIMPVKLNTASARDYMADVIKRFKSDLEKTLGREISEDDLKEAAKTCNEIREVMQQLYSIRIQSPEVIRGEDMHVMVKAGMIMDRYEFLAAVRNIATELQGRAADSLSNKKRFVLSGGLCNMPNVYGAIENAGGVVVGDDLCTGNRFYQGTVSEESDILTDIARRYSERNVCPAKHSGNRARGENLVKLAKEVQADGVIYIFLKFCDPHGFDYPYLKEMLEDNGIPCMLYEMEEQQSGDGQFETRCEAFVEML